MPLSRDVLKTALILLRRGTRRSFSIQRRYWGVKQTCRFALHMSAFDPKRIWLLLRNRRSVVCQFSLTADFTEKFEALIESYNAGSRSIEELLDELMKFTRNLSEEQERHVREKMSEEELVIFDILIRPAPELTGEERAGIEEGRPRTAQSTQAVTGAELAAESSSASAA
jgi:Domain of unknown function (DUF3387)